MASGIPRQNLFRTRAVRLDGPKAGTHCIQLAVNFMDGEVPWLVLVENGVLHAYPDKTVASPDASLTLTILNIKRLTLGLTDAGSLLGSGDLISTGDAAVLVTSAGHFDQFDRGFPLVGGRPEMKAS